MEPREEFFGCDWVFARIESSAPQRFHAHQHGRVRRENLQRIPDEGFRVVSFATAEIPVVTHPRQRLCASDFKAVANERRTCLGNSCETQQGYDQPPSEPS